MKRSGLTLIEILVVVVILAVLALLLLPQLRISHSQNYRQSCQNNLKQIGLAYQMYANESKDGLFPPLQTGPCLSDPQFSQVL